MAVRLRRSKLQVFLVPAVFAVLALALIVFALNRPLPTYLVAARDLLPGQELTGSDVVAVPMDLGEAAGAYVSELAPGFAPSSFVAAGELIPARMLGQPLQANQTLLRITPELRPAETIAPGSAVSIWQVVELEDAQQAQLLVPRAIVIAVAEPEGIFASDLPQVEVLVGAEQAAQLIAAVAGDIPLFLMPLR